jgi:hypothetical protein
MLSSLAQMIKKDFFFSQKNLNYSTREIERGVKGE